MKYFATWYNYIAQCNEVLYINAYSDKEASEIAVLMMDEIHPHHSPHTDENIESLTRQDPDDGKFIGYEEQKKRTEKSLKEYRDGIDAILNGSMIGICISIRENNPNQIELGKKYYLQSLKQTRGKEVYVQAWDYESKKCKGIVALKHFETNDKEMNNNEK